MILKGSKVGNAALRLPGASSSGVVAPPSGDAVITGTEFGTDWIFQRVGTAKTVTISGTYTGTAYGIQARVETFSGASTVVNWTTIVASPTGGAFSATLSVPQGGWYRIKLRDYGNQSAVWSAAKQFGVGIRVATLGQSNMVAMMSSSSTYPTPSPLARRYAGNGFVDQRGGETGYPAPGSEQGYSSYGDGGIVLALNLVTALGVPVAMLQYGVNGSRIGTWAPDGSGTNWNAFATATPGTPPYSLQALDAPDFEVAIWLQGESDQGLLTASQYQTALSGLWTGLKNLTGRTTPGALKFGVGFVGPLWAANVVCDVRQAQVQFVAANASNGVFPVSFIDGVGGDNLHPDYDSHIRLARRYALGITGALGATTYGAAGPHIAGASCATGSANVSVAIAHDHGTALLDGTGGSGTALTGFRVFRNGSTTAETISATAITDATHVTLTLASPRLAGDTMTLDYAAMTGPFAAGAAITTLAPVLYDNAAVPHTTPSGSFYSQPMTTAWSDSLGLPLQPTTPLAITVS